MKTKPIDGAPVERVEHQTGQTMTELNERVVNYFRTYKGMYSQADVEKLLATARAEGAKEFKKNIVKYALDELEHDCLGGSGLSEEVEVVIKRLRYWMLEKEVTNRNIATTKEIDHAE